jgi:hypothetical protein
MRSSSAPSRPATNRAISSRSFSSVADSIVRHRTLDWGLGTLDFRLQTQDY